MSYLVERLAGHLQRPVPESDLQRARAHLLDWLACVAGARRTPVADAARGLPDPVARAALLGNVLEMDDVHRSARLHPGPVVWPAVLWSAGSAPAMLEAGVTGYEAAIALGETLDDHHYAHWHPTATAGLFGAATAAARAMELDATRTAHALGHAASLAGGLWHMRHGDSMTKQVHVLHAAEGGVRCARLAAAGLTGATGSIDGPQGLHEAMCRAPRATELKSGWRMAEVSFKPWAACRHAHPAIDATLELGRVDGPVEIATYRDALLFCDRPHPRTPAEARFSLQHAVAVAVTTGDAQPAMFEAEAIAELALVRARVSVAEEPALTSNYPAHFGARATSAGRSVELRDARGDPERPLAPGDVRAKLQSLCSWGGLDGDAADEASAAIEGGPAALVGLLDRWTA